MFHQTVNDIIESISSPNLAPVDTIVSNGTYRGLVFFVRVPAVGWISPNSAKFTVPAGKKAVVVYIMPNISCSEDPSNRQAQLFNLTTNQPVVGGGNPFAHWGIPGFSSDEVEGTPLPEIGAGETVEVRLFNRPDGNTRTVGAAVVLQVLST